MIIGVDISKWQQEMDWAKCAGAGAKFAFVRAGSIDNVTGNCYTDYQFKRNALLAPEYLPIGFYWYFRPNYDPIKQANYFCDLIDGYDWLLPPVLDLEDDGGKSPAQVTDRAVNFVLRVKERLEVLSLLYSRAYWLNRNTITNEFMKTLDLWIARYTSKGKPWGNLLPWPDLPSIKPRDFDDYDFWQFSKSGHGAEFGAKSKSIDRNYFNGDQAAFDKYIGKPLPSSVVFPDDIGVRLTVEIEDQVAKYKGHVEIE